jgi:hypothetical protein
MRASSQLKVSRWRVLPSLRVSIVQRPACWRQLVVVAVQGVERLRAVPADEREHLASGAV